jgi:hypothetical protein
MGGDSARDRRRHPSGARRFRASSRARRFHRRAGAARQANRRSRSRGLSGINGRRDRRRDVAPRVDLPRRSGARSGCATYSSATSCAGSRGAEDIRRDEAAPRAAAPGFGAASSANRVSQNTRPRVPVDLRQRRGGAGGRCARVVAAMAAQINADLVAEDLRQAATSVSNAARSATTIGPPAGWARSRHRLSCVTTGTRPRWLPRFRLQRALEASMER